ncbi:hypothetical protein ABZY34_14800 [Streptomyces virginiae]|uniref:hypothetical protein n=1 Tax=Streptomyces virginiae TaxID=1961 RepID=UPI0033BC6553
MIGLYILGAMLLFGAFKLLRGVYYIRKAKRLEAEVTAIEARTEALNAETAGIKSERKAQQAAAVVALGFVPEAELDTDNARPVSPEQTAAVAAVKAGDWEAGAAYLDAAGQDWEERWQRLRPLSELAAEDDAWLLAWRRARPSDPSAALVNADTGVLVAWNVRGSARASHTTQEQFRIFRELLLKAQEQAREAQRLADPADPVPYMVEQSISQGLGYSHEEYRQLWSQIVERDPKNLSAHTSAMQYWSQKWRGSHELALAFAHECAAKAEPGELLSLLPLIAYVEQELHESDLKPETFFKEPEARRWRAPWPTSRRPTRTTGGRSGCATCWRGSCSGRTGTRRRSSSSATSTGTSGRCPGTTGRRRATCTRGTGRCARSRRACEALNGAGRSGPGRVGAGRGESRPALRALSLPQGGNPCSRTAARPSSPPARRP